jgi:4-amino-4-deoxy-L-arabinose transferase-like glycosyltransferase
MPPLPRPALTLLLLALLTFFLGLGRPAIGDTDEGFYAESAREMVESGDWLTPHFNYDDRWQKPVLYYWGAAALYLVTGPSEWSARFWSALSGVGLVMLTWMAARRLLRREDAAFLAGAIVATSYGYFFIARQALPDLPLTFFITLTIWLTLERRWLWAGVAAGLGFLTKGPVALLIPAIVVVPIWWRERAWPRVPDLMYAACVAALVGLPWYVAMTATHGTAYLQSFFVGDNLERFATSRFNGPRFVLYYVPIVIGGILPWSAYLLWLPWRRGIAVLRRQAQLTAAEWQLVFWTLAPLVFYTLSVGKQPRYILPVLPPMAMLLAGSMTRRIAPQGDDAPLGTRGLAAATWTTAAMLIAVAILLLRARSLFLTAYPALTVAGIAAIFAAAAAVAFIAMTRRWHALPMTMTGAGAVALLSLQFGAMAGVRPEPVEEMAALVRANHGAEPIGEYQVFVRNLGFYTGTRQTELYDESQAVSFLRSPDRVLLVVRADDLARIESAAGVAAQRLGEVRYVNTANLKLRTLLAPDPARDIERVLLVANR